jgi:hypothetical protein
MLPSAELIIKESEHRLRDDHNRSLLGFLFDQQWIIRIIQAKDL